MRPSLFDCFVVNSIAPYTSYLDALSDDERRIELAFLAQELHEQQADRELMNSYRTAILQHYHVPQFNFQDLSAHDDSDAPSDGELLEMQRMDELYERMRLHNLPALRYSAVVTSVVARVLTHHFRLGDYEHCRSYIEELGKQERYVDLYNLQNCLHTILSIGDVNHRDDPHTIEEQFMHLDDLLSTALLSEEVDVQPPFELLPTYASKKRLDAYFHRADQSLPVGMLPNPDPDIEDAVKLFVNRRDAKGLVDFVDYHISALVGDADRLATGKVEACYLIMVLLHYYSYLGAAPELDQIVPALSNLLSSVLHQHQPRYRSI